VVAALLTNLRATEAPIHVGSCPEISGRRTKQEDETSTAKVSELSATSTKGFEDALKQGIARAHKTLRNVQSAWVKEQHVESGAPSATAS
jgi:flavin-binding protein dodecin